MYWQVLIWATVMVLSWLLAPKPQQPEVMHPASSTDFDVPVAEEGRPIPVLFGTRLISSANVVWWGDISISPITRSPEQGSKKG
jgi:predicted phage tail protein